MNRGKPLEPIQEEMEDALPHEVRGGGRLYPVDIQWKPGFTMLVNLVGHGDPQVTLSLCFFLPPVSVPVTFVSHMTPDASPQNPALLISVHLCLFAMLLRTFY
jgi:hypothetical protein